ncbi:hypothetical protein CWI38_1461p0010 [Hamiltosporidium tvaerminnensis]|uniref:Uncharacterized protein n=1 Tax=Hamiltosporidium tvaerminnensis TaxID=1176355 RepID=A0A4Q9LT83_9MICR|nr:hypothetical protein CWI38_1461p0010 [Hamiltosporidium tvaerminnensis]
MYSGIEGMIIGYKETNSNILLLNKPPLTISKTFKINNTPLTNNEIYKTNNTPLKPNIFF